MSRKVYGGGRDDYGLQGKSMWIGGRAHRLQQGARPVVHPLEECRRAPHASGQLAELRRVEGLGAARPAARSEGVRLESLEGGVGPLLTRGVAKARHER